MKKEKEIIVLPMLKLNVIDKTEEEINNDISNIIKQVKINVDKIEKGE